MTGIVQSLIGSFGSVVSAATDAYFYLVTLLLPGNGTNGAQNNTFLDSGTANSGSGFTITRNGNTTQGTFSPFSQTGWSSYNASTSTANVGIYLNNQTDFAFGTGDFTIEMFVNLIDSGSTQVIYDSRPSSTQGLYPTIYLDNSTLKLKYFTNSADRITQTSTFTYNVWHHVVVTRTGTSTKMFIDGTQEGSTYTDSNNYLVGTDRPFTGDGNNSSGTSGVLGYISNLRVVKGSGPYQSAGSSITVPASQLTAVTNTVLLTLQSNRFVDNNTQTTAKTINPFNSPSVQAFSPFAPTAAYSAATNGGSGYFDGNGDYLSAGSNAAFAFGTGAYTVECWVYPTSTANQSFVGNDTTNGSVFYYETAAGFIIAPRAGSSIVSGGIGKLIANQWNHIVYCRASTSTNQTSIFANGERVANGTDSTNWTVTGPCLIGGLAANIYMVTGYISGTRIVKGTDVYGYSNTSITVPTAPPTSITDTQLLLNFTNAGITDATSKNDLETVGNAQISTTQSKFGGSSMYFDGTGDWLSIPASKYWYIGTGDYTIEAWIYPTAWGDLLSCFKTTSPYDGWNLQIGGGGSSNGVMNLFVSNGTTFADYNATTAMSLNTWTHIAVVKSGTTLYQFINGTLDKTTTGILTPADSNNVLLVGVSNLSTRPYTGYIDDLRITKGYARYTASFTAPTAPFPTQ